MSQHAAGNIDVSKMIKKITLTPTRATKYRKVLASVDKSKEKEKFKKHTPSEALSIFVEANLSKKQYEVIHAANKNIYPCYSLIKNAKQDCYPKEVDEYYGNMCRSQSTRFARSYFFTIG